MDCDVIKRFVLIAASVSMMLDGQASIPPARAILDLDQGAQITFINQTIELGFPEDRADQMTMLIINRSAVALPLLESKLAGALKSTSSESFVATATEMIAYAGDEQSLLAIGKLIAMDEKRFGPLVGRTLDNAANWRNPFTVAYRSFELGDEAIARHVMKWLQPALRSNRMQRAWAEAMVDRYGKAPSETEWTIDPIASRMKQEPSPELRNTVSRIATEVQKKRERK